MRAGQIDLLDRLGQSAETMDQPDVVQAGAPVEGFDLPCASFWTIP